MTTLPRSVQAMSLTISDTNAHTSDEVYLGGALGSTLQLVTTGTLAGAWAVTARSHPDATQATVTSAFTPAIAAVSSGGSNQMTIVPAAFFDIQVSFTATSGTGIASVYVQVGNSDRFGR